MVGMQKDNHELFLDFYRDQPCQFLPNAFWKTERLLNHSSLTVERNSNGGLSFLMIREDSRIFSCWCDKSKKTKPSIGDSIRFKLALVHGDCLEVFKDLNFSQKTAFFRILHKGAPPDDSLPEDYYYERVDPSKDLALVSSFINQCYQNIKVNKKIVESWLDHPVYDPNLWVWIKETGSDQLAALGIAEIDHRVPEASLEWVQVHPDFQRRGLGSAIVGELLRRVSPRVDFTTVSGDVNNPSNPEILYREMGFTGSDVWWMLRA
jgi:ribosomal protein S18 acetylase RimI-like enzyme